MIVYQNIPSSHYVFSFKLGDHGTYANPNQIYVRWYEDNNTVDIGNVAIFANQGSGSAYTLDDGKRCFFPLGKEVTLTMDCDSHVKPLKGQTVTVEVKDGRIDITLLDGNRSVLKFPTVTSNNIKKATKIAVMSDYDPIKFEDVKIKDATSSAAPVGTTDETQDETPFFETGTGKGVIAVIVIAIAVLIGTILFLALKRPKQNYHMLSQDMYQQPYMYQSPQTATYLPPAPMV